VVKALKFIGDEGAPTQRYHAFLDRTQAPAVLAEAIRDSYSDLFQAHIHAQSGFKSDRIDPATFAELCRLADFQTSQPESEESKKVEMGTRGGKINKNEAETKKWKKIRIDGFGYRVLIVPPKSNGHSRARSRWTLSASFLMAIVTVAALVSIFGGPLHEWSKTTTVFRAFVASDIPLARPAVRTPANSN
jgi:Family of unknown function (DUF5343)